MSRRWRGPAAIAVVVIAGLGLGLLLLRPSSGSFLDPDSAAPNGSRALVQVLRDHDIEVRVRDSYEQVRQDVEGASARVTIVVARPDRLGVGRALDLAQMTENLGVDLVMVGPGNDVLADLGLPFGAHDVWAGGPLEPACAAALPSRAGSADIGETAYSRNGSGTADVRAVASCYPVPGDSDGKAATYIEARHADARTTTLLGSGEAMTNERLAREGNAALTIGALGQHDLLVWWSPNPLDGAGQQTPPTLSELFPDGVRYGVLQLGVVLLVLVLWRARRFGRLVAEPLPVVVRAIETTRGRAQLYRRARAGGRAALVLRAATTRRLAVRVGLARTAPVPVVVAAVASATGRPADQVESLLVGAHPADDATLVRLARDLLALETEVHRS